MLNSSNITITCNGTIIRGQRVSLDRSNFSIDSFKAAIIVAANGTDTNDNVDIGSCEVRNYDAGILYIAKQPPENISGGSVHDFHFSNMSLGILSLLWSGYHIYNITGNTTTIGIATALSPNGLIEDFDITDGLNSGCVGTYYSYDTTVRNGICHNMSIGALVISSWNNKFENITLINSGEGLSPVLQIFGIVAPFNLSGIEIKNAGIGVVSWTGWWFLPGGPSYNNTFKNIAMSNFNSSIALYGLGDSTDKVYDNYFYNIVDDGR